VDVRVEVPIKTWGFTPLITARRSWPSLSSHSESLRA
jgi:hypothetical protein